MKKSNTFVFAIKLLLISYFFQFFEMPKKLNIFNTLTRKKESFFSVKKEVSFYTCGPTVYNVAHLGNFRAYISADVLRRWLQFGHNKKVNWVLNITDVDDKTIRDSRKKFPSLLPKKSLKRFTQFYEKIFFDDLKKLGIDKKFFFANPRATEFISQMQELVRKIFQNGFAYCKSGSIFFDVGKFSSTKKYGQMIELDLKNLKTSSRNLADEKDDCSDFVLWKAQKEGEPFWDFDFFGENFPGRPGWHLECSAMEFDIFKELPFDIHSGGVDLIFPHHENEIAQSVAGYKKSPTNFWFHNEHLLVDGKKMSKSLGNFLVLDDVLKKGFSPDTARFFLVINHYRKKLNLNDKGLRASEIALQKIRNFVHKISKITSDPKSSSEKNDLQNFKIIEEKFFTAMNDDLNTPVAVAAIFELIKIFPTKASKSLIEKTKNFFQLIQNVFGVSVFPEIKKIPLEILKLSEEREQKKQNKDFVAADKIRDEIEQKGFLLRDRKNLPPEILPKQ